jgi:hypothetical protein
MRGSPVDFGAGLGRTNGTHPSGSRVEPAVKSDVRSWSSSTAAAVTSLPPSAAAPRTRPHVLLVELDRRGRHQLAATRCRTPNSPPPCSWSSSTAAAVTSYQLAA